MQGRERNLHPSRMRWPGTSLSRGASPPGSRRNRAFSHGFSRERDAYQLPPELAPETSTGLTPAPKKRGRGSGFYLGKRTVIVVIAILIVIVAVGAGAIFLLPMLTSGEREQWRDLPAPRLLLSPQQALSEPLRLLLLPQQQRSPSPRPESRCMSTILAGKKDLRHPGGSADRAELRDRYLEIVNATGSIRPASRSLGQFNNACPDRRDLQRRQAAHAGKRQHKVWYGDSFSGRHNGRCPTRADRWKDTGDHHNGSGPEW